MHMLAGRVISPNFHPDPEFINPIFHTASQSPLQTLDLLLAVTRVGCLLPIIVQSTDYRRYSLGFHKYLGAIAEARVQYFNTPALLVGRACVRVAGRTYSVCLASSESLLTFMRDFSL